MSTVQFLLTAEGGQLAADIRDFMAPLSAVIIGVIGLKYLFGDQRSLAGFIGFLLLFIGLQGLWEQGAALAASMLTAAIMTAKRFSPGLAWKRWQLARARAKLSVIDGGKKPKGRDEQKWLN